MVQQHVFEPKLGQACAWAAIVALISLALPVVSHAQDTPNESAGANTTEARDAADTEDAPLSSEDEADDSHAADSVLQYTAPKEFEMLIGLRINSGDGNMLSTTAMTVFPTDWPEQTVEIVEVNVPPPLSSQFRDLPNNNKQLLFFSPLIRGNSTVEGTVRVRIQKSHTVGPDDTTGLQVPRRLPREIKGYLGNSPYIEADSSEIRKIVREVDASEPLTDWKRVELLYDWVRDNIVYENGELKTVREALRDRTGDCEEMTSVFVALCRAARIPARVVWIPNHCYPEFYLADESGQGHWFPCQVAGTRNFGSMPEYLPILQKGDRFKVPEKSELQRYLADYLNSKKVLGRKDPEVEFIRQLLGDAANLPTPDLDGTANEAE